MPRGYASGRSVPERYPERYRPDLVAASRRYHIPARVLAAQEFKESSYDRDVISGARKSSAGAGGISQFIASTGRQYGVKLGTSRRAVRTQINAHARYLRDLGYAKDPRHAVASYAGGPGNPQYGYAAGVFDLARSYQGIARGVRGGGAGGGGSRVVGGTPATASRSAQQAGGSALAELTAKGLQRQQGPPSFTLPPPPVHTAHVVLPEGQAAGSPQSGLVTPQAASQPTLRELLQAASADARTQDAATTVNPGTPGTRVPGGGGSSGGGGLGRVRVNPGADRAGVKTRPATIRFARKVAGILGHPLTIGTGTNHSQMTTSGNVSEHWSGHAVDIPLVGRALTRAGHAALIAAGMPRAQARRAKGGIYNVGNHQIIFNTTDGGNHWNHLHISTH